MTSTSAFPTTLKDFVAVSIGQERQNAKSDEHAYTSRMGISFYAPDDHSPISDEDVCFALSCRVTVGRPYEPLAGRAEHGYESNSGVGGHASGRTRRVPPDQRSKSPPARVGVVRCEEDSPPIRR